MKIQTSKTPLFGIVVRAERDIAFDSPDHLMPWGTAQDNSVNWRFNDKLYGLFPTRERSLTGGRLRLLDMGCSGGGFVRHCIDDGCVAIGLEGSDFSKNHRRAEWRSIPEFLFTCDVTREFEIDIEKNGTAERAQFDVVTCWEMMEHIAPEEIAQVAANVTKHLAPGGIWIMSVSPNTDEVGGVALHRTVQPKPWWVDKFQQLGLEHSEELVRYFNTQFVRGPKYGAPGSFHLVLSPKGASRPVIPKEGILRRLNDLWVGSLVQRLVRA